MKDRLIVSKKVRIMASRRGEEEDLEDLEDLEEQQLQQLQ